MSVQQQIDALRTSILQKEEQYTKKNQDFQNLMAKINTVTTEENPTNTQNIKNIRNTLKKYYKPAKTTAMKVIGAFSPATAKKNKNARYANAKAKYKHNLSFNRMREMPFKYSSTDTDKNELWLLENGLEYMIEKGIVDQDTVTKYENMGWKYVPPSLGQARRHWSEYNRPAAAGHFEKGRQSIAISDMKSKLNELMQQNANRKAKANINAKAEKEKQDAIKQLTSLGYTYYPYQAQRNHEEQIGMQEYRTVVNAKAVDEHLLYETSRTESNPPSNLAEWEKKSETTIIPAHIVESECGGYQGYGMCRNEVPEQTVIKTTYTRQLPAGLPSRIESSEIISKAKELASQTGGRRRRTRRARRFV
jgi:hypothetical protein